MKRFISEKRYQEIQQLLKENNCYDFFVEADCCDEYTEPCIGKLRFDGYTWLCSHDDEDKKMGSCLVFECLNCGKYYGYNKNGIFEMYEM